MDNQAVNARTAKPGAGATKLLLLAGLSVQAWGVLVGVSLIIMNWAR